MLKSLAIFIITFNFIISQNKNPIFLIHGFMGWGRDEVEGYYYWGGKLDLEQYLKEQGYEVFTISVGPISSNWDRAIEAYYQIKGGQVNYGKSHSNKYKIIQKPICKSYNGYFPQWNDDNPIHIISHSQGGQTARMLEYLLKYNNLKEDSDLLSEKKEGWIKSITTISTPHNGTTLVPIVEGMVPFIRSTTVWLGMLSNYETIENYFNFDLDQWDLIKKPNEKVITYLRRIKESNITNSKNFSSWDLSPAGSNEFNEIYITDSTVYYFSFLTTFGGEKNRSIRLKYKLQERMIRHLGHYPEEWKENDGLVNTISMRGPKTSKIVLYDGKPAPGAWQVMEKLYLDHHEVLGHLYQEDDYDYIKALYNNHCQLIYSIY